jgi:hypothetical protein
MLRAMPRRSKLLSRSFLISLGALTALVASRCTSSELPAFARPPSLEEAAPMDLDGGAADALSDAR